MARAVSLSPDPIRFGSTRFLHDADLAAIGCLGDRILGLADGELSVWSPSGERLQRIRIGEDGGFGGWRFYPSRVPGRTVLGPGTVLSEALFFSLELADGAVSVRASLPHALDTAVSYYLDAVDLGDEILVAHGGGLARRPWSGGPPAESLASPLPPSQENGAAISGDGRLVAFSGYPEPRVVVLDRASGAVRAQLSPTAVHGASGPMLCFTSDGERLLTAFTQGWATTVEEWDLRTGERVRELVSHVGTGDVLGIEVSGELLLLRKAGVDVLAWDLGSGRLAWSRSNQPLPAVLTRGEAGLFAASGRRIAPLDPATGAPGQCEGTDGPARSVVADRATGRVVACDGAGAVVFGADGAVVERLEAQRVHAVPGGGEVLLERRGRRYGEIDLFRCRLGDGACWLLLSGALTGIHHAGPALIAIDNSLRDGALARIFSPWGRERRSFGRGRPDLAAGSPDGQRVATAKGTRLSLHDAATGARIWSRDKAHKKAPQQIAFSPDGQRLASASVREVAVWDGQGAEPLLRVAVDGEPRLLAWLDDARIVALTDRGALHLLPLDGEPERWAVQGPVASAALAEDGTLVVGTSGGELLRYALGERLGLAPAAPRPQGAFLDATPLADADDARITEALRAADWAAFRPERDLEPLRDLLLALEAREGVGTAHHLASARLIERGVAALRHRSGHEEAMTAFGLSRDGRWLATGSWVGEDYDRGGTLQIWEVRTGRCVNVLDPIRGGVGWPDYGGCAKWSPDGARIGLAYDTNGVGSFLPFEDGVAIELSCYATDGWSRPPAWCWSPDGGAVVVFAWGGTPVPGGVVSVREGEAFEHDVRWFSGDVPEGIELQPQIEGLWTPDGARIQGHDRERAYAVDARQRELRWVAPIALPAAWSPDGRWLAHCGDGLCIHDATTGERVHQIALDTLISAPEEGGEGGLTQLAWSPDGRTLAAVGSDGVALFREGRAVGRVPGSPAERPWDLPDAAPWAFSPDGLRGALLEASGELSVWALSDPPRCLARTEVEDVGGVLFGDGGIAVFGQGVLELRETDGLERFASYRPGEPRSDRIDEPSPLQRDELDAGLRFPRDPTFLLEGDEGWRWAIAFPTGLVVCPEELRDQLDEELSIVVARRWALPFRWLDAPVFDTLADAADHAALPLTPSERTALLPKRSKRRASRGDVPLPTAPGPIGGLTDAWWASVSGLHAGWHSHISEQLGVQVLLLLRAGDLDRAGTAVERILDPWPRAAAFAHGARILSERGERTLAEAWLARAEELAEEVLDEHNETFVCGALAAACAALGRSERVEPLLAQARERVAEEINPFERRTALAAALRRCGRPGEADAVLDEGPLGSGMVPSMLADHVVELLREDPGAGIRAVDRIIERNGACNELAILDAGVEALVSAGRATEVPAFAARFDGLSTDDAIASALDALDAAGRRDEARAVLDAVIAETAPWPASRARWAPRLVAADREAGSALVLELLEQSEALAQSYDPGRALGPLCEALAALGRGPRVLRLAEDVPDEPQRLSVLIAALRGAPGDAALLEAATACLAGIEALRPAASAAAALAAVAPEAQAAALWDEAIAIAARAAREDRRWVIDDLVREAVAQERWQEAWRALQVAPRSKRRYSMGPLVDALAERGLADAVVLVAGQLGTDDLNDRPNTLFGAITRFRSG